MTHDIRLLIAAEIDDPAIARDLGRVVLAGSIGWAFGPIFSDGDDLVDTIEAEDEIGGFTVYDGQFSDVSELQRFCEANGLPYRMESCFSHMSDVMDFVTAWRPGMDEPRSSGIDAEGYPMLSTAALGRALDEGADAVRALRDRLEHETMATDRFELRFGTDAAAAIRGRTFVATPSK